MFLERHEDKWMPEPNTGCYIWTGALTGGKGSRPSAGTGDGKTAKVARVTCEEVNGPAPTPSHHAVHNTPNGCVGGLCVNGEHLRWATQKENMQDVPAWLRSDRIRRGAASMTMKARQERSRKMNAARWSKDD